MRRRKELTILGLTARLCLLTEAWNATDIPSAGDQAVIRELGERLNEAGGLRAMQGAYHAAHDLNRYASPINHYWNGVGDWLA